jgi:hypothetical protein
MNVSTETLVELLREYGLRGLGETACYRTRIGQTLHRYVDLWWSAARQAGPLRRTTSSLKRPACSVISIVRKTRSRQGSLGRERGWTAL